MSATTPLWLDCDPGTAVVSIASAPPSVSKLELTHYAGHDDVFAILLAAHHPSLNLLGISTVHGNASLTCTTSNAVSVLTAIGRSDVPVYPGADKPFCRSAVHAPDIHGNTGLDGTDLLPLPRSAPNTTTPALVAIRDALLKQPTGSAWVVATGALTNVGLLFAAFPELVPHIAGLSIMGGAVGGGFTDAPMGKVKGEGPRIGNITPWAEFNIYCDPEAAASIFSNPSLASKTTLIPLDLTHQIPATASVLSSLLHGTSLPLQTPSPLRRMLHDLLTFFAHTYSSVFGISAGPPLHDPLAVAVLLESHSKHELSFDDRGERWDVEVVTEGKHGEKMQGTLKGHIEGMVGRTMIKRKEGAEVGVRIPRSLNVDGFWKVIMEAVARTEKEVIGKGVWEGH